MPLARHGAQYVTNFMSFGEAQAQHTRHNCSIPERNASSAFHLNADLLAKLIIIH
jgi:hypothetical protein